MSDNVIEKAATVTLRGKEYPIEFSLHACALYQRETATLDRGRRAENGLLTAAESEALREERRQLLRQADAVQQEIAALPEEAAEKAEKTERFYELVGRALTIKKQLDGNAARGDSLFVEADWFKLTADDPERVLLALWAGLHQLQETQAGASWAAPLTLAQLREYVDPANLEDIIEAIGRVLAGYAGKKNRGRTTPAFSPESVSSSNAERNGP